MDASTAWFNLQEAVRAMHDPEGDYQLGLATVYAGIELMFEHDPEEIVKQVENSSLPTRPTVSWLVYEGERLSQIDNEKAAELRAYWESQAAPGEGIMPPPPGVTLV